MTYTTLEVSESGGIARLTLARPDQRNALDLTTCVELAHAAAAIEASPTVKVLVLSGRGSAFSVGGDIAHFVKHRDDLRDELLKMTAAFHAAILSMQRMPAPLLVGVNGVAAGGGFSLVCGADLAVAKRSAKLVSAYTRSGLTPDGGGTWFLPRRVGHQRAFDLMAMNPTLTAEEAQAIGLVSRVVDDDAFDAELDKVATHVASLPSGAAQALKRLLHASEARSLADHFKDEEATLSQIGSSEETLGRLDAFLKKRV
jgi:2-(1,2-epoxy-1,2-dihydrophenyl)acetyl-CoA isomerase